MKDELVKVKEIIDHVLKNDDYPNIISPRHLRDAVRAYPCRGGKRVRPALTMWCCGLVGGDVRLSEYAAAAIEVYHNWTLVHDDIIDNDDFRRGAPTTHNVISSYAEKHLDFGHSKNTPRKYGRDMAILAGDLQQGWANNLLLKSVNHGVDIDIVLALSIRLQELVNRELISGEALDVEFSYKDIDSIDEVGVETMLYLKTGVLLQFCAEVGASIGLGIADINNKDVQDLGHFAATAGVAFQFRDDWLGVFGNASTFGKQVCADVSEGKPTVLFISALKGLPESEKELLLSFIGKSTYSDSDIETIRTLIRKSGAEDIVEKKCDQLIGKARAILERFPDNKYRSLLFDWLDFLVVRNV